MAQPASNPWISPAIKIAAAGLGAAVAGPLGGAVGGWLGETIAGPTAELLKKCAEKFGEKSAEKLLDTGADSLLEKLKGEPLQLESVYREALCSSLSEIHKKPETRDCQDWFENWDRCLSASETLNL